MLHAFQTCDVETPARPNILLLEDDPVTRSILTEMIKSVALTAQVHCLARADELVSGLYLGLDVSRIDLVICDFFLEGPVNGLQTWSAWQDRYAVIPFVLISTMEQDEYAIRTISMRGKAPIMIQKPLNQEICNTLMKFVPGAPAGSP